MNQNPCFGRFNPDDVECQTCKQDERCKEAQASNLREDRSQKVESVPEPEQKAAPAWMQIQDYEQWAPEYESRLLALLIRDEDAFRKCGSLLCENHLQFDFHRDILTIVQNHFDKYGSLPKPEEIKNEIKDFFYKTRKKDIEIETYNEELDNLFAIDLQNKDYIEEKLSTFLQNQAMKALLLESGKNYKSLNPDWRSFNQEVQAVLDQTDALGSNILSKLRTWHSVDPNKKTDWLIENILPNKAITTIYGAGGLGKSHVVYAMARCIQEGLDFFGHKAKQLPVYYLDYENPEDVKAHIKQTSGDSDMLLWDLSEDAPPLPKFRKEGGGFNVLKPFPKGVVVIDTVRAATGLNIQDDTEAALMMQEVISIKKMGIAVILILHTLKADPRTFKGNQVILDQSDHAIALYKVKRVGETDPEESDNTVNDKPVLLFFGTPADIKSRYLKNIMFLRYDPNVPSLNVAKAPDPEFPKLLLMWEALQDLFNGTKERPCQKEWKQSCEEVGVKHNAFYRLVARGTQLRYWKEFDDDTPKSYLPLSKPVL